MKQGFLKHAAVVVSSFMAIAATVGLVPSQPETMTASAADCVIDTSVEYQTMRGFGGINHPEWVGDLTAAQRQTAFGNGENELGFTILRVFVNEDSSQWSRAVETAKTAQAMGATIFASPWNPPNSMSEPYNGSRRLRHDKYADYAQHLNNFVLFMRQNGVELYSISVQNEPDYAHEWTWWSSDETTNFLENYAHVIDCNVMSPETFQYTNKDFYTKILNNSKAYANTDVFATHFYGTQRSQMDFPQLENCGKEIWMTEVYVPNSSSDADTWPEALQVAENIHNGLVVGNMSAYVWWYIRRFYSPMKENGQMSKRGACMAQYSKWVRNGDIRVSATEQPNTNILVSAYKNDGKVVVVAINKGTGAATQHFTFANDTVTSVSRYRTSGSENAKYIDDITVNNNGFDAQLPAQSVTTFVTDASATPIEPDANGYFFHDTFEGDTFGWSGRGDAEVLLSGRTPYAGTEALLVQNRTSAWHGTQKTLSPAAFKPGEEFSFSVCVNYVEGDATETFKLTLQYTDASGETQYANVATATGTAGSYVQLANQNYKIPDGAKNMYLYVEAEDDNVSFYIDEAIGALPGTKIDGPAGFELLLGDANADGTIDGTDFTIAKKIVLGFEDDALAKLAADVNQDNRVSISDVVWYAKYLTGQVKDYPAQGEIVDGDVPPVAAMRTISEYTPVVAASVSEFEPNDARQEKAGVSYGTVKSGTYYSTTCNRNKPYNILLPAGYTESKQYPVMYVMHGYWENQDRMIIQGNGTMYTRQIIGNAIASGDAVDMIVVFPYIYSSATQENCSAMDDANNAAYDNFINDLVKDLMPHIESTYSVKTGRENTAITGFSMGGRESLLIGMKRPDLFGYVGAICAAPGVTGSFKWASEEEAPSLVFLTAGSNDEVVYNTPEGYHNSFNSNGVPHIWHYVNGGYHGDNCIHAHIYNFARAVFKA